MKNKQTILNNMNMATGTQGYTRFSPLQTILNNNMNMATGTQGYTRFSPFAPNHVLTDGVLRLCEDADCFWLVEAIASHHHKIAKDQEMIRFQPWKLKVKDNKATLTCLKDNYETDKQDIFIKQNIPYTDFPLDEVDIWVEQSGNLFVMLLPMEH